jgi:peptide/nickel transport system ATP-binding protein
MAVLFITHDLGVVAEMADDVAVMYLGKIVEQSDVNDHLPRPAAPLHPGPAALDPQDRHEREELDPIKGMVPNPFRRPSGCTFNPRCTQSFDACRVREPLNTTLRENHSVRCLLYEKN